MKFLDTIQRKLTILEQDAAMPVDPNAPVSPDPGAAAADAIGQQATEQVQKNIKLCADIVNALVVFITGKFADQIESTPGLFDQMKQLEQQTTVTDVDQINPKLLETILSSVNSIKSL